MTEWETSISNGEGMTDDFDKTGFFAGFDEESGGEDQPAAGDQTAQETGEAAGGEDQPAGGEPSETEVQETTQGDQPEQAEETVQLRYNGNAFAVPVSAVRAISGAIGQADVVGLLQKGMNYESKAERELRLLDQFAAAQGVNRAQYLDFLEQHMNEYALTQETERVRGTMPEGTPDEALRKIAEGNLKDRRAAQKQESVRRRAAEIEQQRQAQAQRIYTDRARWAAYLKASGVKKAADVPEEVRKLVKDGMSPLEAHYTVENRRLQQELAAAKKNNRNRETAPGSLGTSGGDQADAFLAGFLGE